jgi:hypothetical protein
MLRASNKDRNKQTFIGIKAVYYQTERLATRNKYQHNRRQCKQSKRTQYRNAYIKMQMIAYCVVHVKEGKINHIYI